MKRRRVTLLGPCVLILLSTGCVDRRFVVETNVPGAQIYVDGTPIGPSPADSWWEYAGDYQFTAVAPGYEPLVKKVKLKAKWYQYPPFDLVAEALWPFRIEDVRRVQLTLEPVRPINQQELIGAADELRARGLTLPPTSVPDTKAPKSTPPTVRNPASGVQLPKPMLPVPNNFIPYDEIAPRNPDPTLTRPADAPATPDVVPSLPAPREVPSAPAAPTAPPAAPRTPF